MLNKYIASLGQKNANTDHSSPLMTDNHHLIKELRSLILTAAPDPEQAVPVRTCRADALLDDLIPFSSVIVLGVIIAVEDRFDITVTRQAFVEACAEGATLESLSAMIATLQATPTPS